jgi:hypothetical protein
VVLVNIATLVVWLLAAVAGLALVAIWLQRGGLEVGRPRRFPRPLPFAHAAAAVISLVLFLVYWAADIDGLKLVVLAGLLLTAVLGITMFVNWVAKFRQPATGTVGAASAAPAEDAFPTALVALHGVAAVATLILYIVAAFIVAS